MLGLQDLRRDHRLWLMDGDGIARIWDGDEWKDLGEIVHVERQLEVPHVDIPVSETWELSKVMIVRKVRFRWPSPQSYICFLHSPR